MYIAKERTRRRERKKIHSNTHMYMDILHVHVHVYTLLIIHVYSPHTMYMYSMYIVYYATLTREVWASGCMSFLLLPLYFSIRRFSRGIKNEYCRTDMHMSSLEALN